jgi:putative FmdB family regulatory protein
MPIYEYHCNDCKKTFSVQVSFGEHEKHPKPVCTYCGSKNVKRLFAGVSVITSKKS